MTLYNFVSNYSRKKMKEIVLNGCYGGFGLPDKVMDRYHELGVWHRIRPRGEKPIREIWQKL